MREHQAKHLYHHEVVFLRSQSFGGAIIGRVELHIHCKTTARRLAEKPEMQILTIAFMQCLKGLNSILQLVLRYVFSGVVGRRSTSSAILRWRGCGASR
jgi:hypothetical protein